MSTRTKRHIQMLVLALEVSVALLELRQLAKDGRP
jgi:hypothetical protein